MLKIKDRYISTENIKEAYIDKSSDWDGWSGKYIPHLIIIYKDNSKIDFKCNSENAKPLFDYFDSQVLKEVEELEEKE